MVLKLICIPDSSSNKFNITIHQEYHHVQHGQNIGIMDERIHHSQSMHGLSHQHTNMQYGVHRMLESHYE